MAGHPYRFKRHVQNLIANFRGVPENYKPDVRPNERDLGSVMDNVLDRYKIGVESLEDRIRENWPEIVGPPVAQNCQPLRIDNGTTLFIAVSNPIIRQELQFNKAIVLKNVKAIKGGHKIRNIVFRSG